MAYKAHNSWSRGIWGFPSSSDGKASACNAGDLVRSLGQEDPLEKEMAAHCSILAWRIPWTVAYQAPGSSPWDCKESDTTEPLHFTSLHFTLGGPGEVRWPIGLKIPLLIDRFYLGQSSIPEPNMFQFQR